MSHLGYRLSALVDGELSADERDKAHAHLARCEQCRAEANELRALKKQLRALGDVPPPDALTRRLTGIAEPGAPVPPRRRARRQRSATAGPAPRPGFRTVPGAAVAPPSRAARSSRAPGTGHRWHRRRYLALGVVSCVFAGLGVTAFTMGGDQQTPAPRITPQVQLYSAQHAITTGQLPSGGSSSVPAPEFAGSAPLP